MFYLPEHWMLYLSIFGAFLNCICWSWSQNYIFKKPITIWMVTSSFAIGTLPVIGAIYGFFSFCGLAGYSSMKLCDRIRNRISINYPKVVKFFSIQLFK